MRISEDKFVAQVRREASDLCSINPGLRELEALELRARHHGYRSFTHLRNLSR